MEDLWKYIRVHRATGQMMTPPNSDNREEITDWYGYKICIALPEHESDNDDELLNQQYPGILDIADTYWFYRTGFRGSADIVHFAFANYDPGNEYQIYDTLHNAGVILLRDEVQEPRTFLEMLVVYISEYGNSLAELTKAQEVYQLGDTLPLEIVREILQYR